MYKSVLLGDALIVYSRKLKKENEKDRNKFKLELMKLEILGKMITGENIGLLDDFEKSPSGEKRRSGKQDEALLMKAGFKITTE